MIPSGWMFKSAMYDGRDIADEPFDLESTDVKGVVVTFTTRGTRLSGAVRSERGRPDPETSVLLYPASPSAWTPTVSILRMRSVRTSATGTYSLTSIPPGEYLRGRGRRGNIPGLAGSEAARGAGATCHTRSHRRRPDARAGLENRSRSITPDCRLRLPTRLTTATADSRLPTPTNDCDCRLKTADCRLSHPCRSATVGSTRAARHAGSAHASTTDIAITAAAPA